MAEYTAIYGTGRYGESKYGVLLRDLSESYGLSDDYSKIWSLARIYSETSNLSDDLDIIKQILKGLSESFSLSDAYSRVWTATPTLTESLSLSDGDAYAVARILTESFGLSDDLLNSITRELTESHSLSDNLIKSIAREITENYSLSEAYSRVWTLARTYSESLSLTDGDVYTIARVLLESLNLSDAYSKVLTILREYTETVSLSDYLDASRMILKELAESFGLDDGDMFFSFVRLLTESIGLTDLVYYSTSRLPEDFNLGPLVGFGETVTRTPVTVTTDFHGQKTYTDGETEDLEVIFINPNRNFALNKSGLTEVADALMFVKGDATINKYDKITYDSEDYRVDTIDDRQEKGIVGFKLVSLYLI